MKKEINKFFLVLTGTVLTTRIWSSSVYIILRNNPQAINRIINDRIHHYHVGLIILLLTYLLRKTTNKSQVFFAVGFGILLEELPVFLNDLGFGLTKFYRSGWDILLVLLLITMTYYFTLEVSKPHRIEN